MRLDNAAEVKLKIHLSTLINLCFYWGFYFIFRQPLYLTVQNVMHRNKKVQILYVKLILWERDQAALK